MDMEIVSTSGVDSVEVPDDVAADLAEAYAALAKLPVNRAVSVNFTSDGYAGPKKVNKVPVTDADKAAWNARRFVRQGKAWATANGLAFARKGDIKGNPSQVRFRIYVPRDTDNAESE